MLHYLMIQFCGNEKKQIVEDCRRFIAQRVMTMRNQCPAISGVALWYFCMCANEKKKKWIRNGWENNGKTMNDVVFEFKSFVELKPRFHSLFPLFIPEWWYYNFSTIPLNIETLCHHNSPYFIVMYKLLSFVCCVCEFVYWFQLNRNDFDLVICLNK